METSSLLERRRQRLLANVVPKNALGQDMVGVLSDATTTSSSQPATPGVSPTLAPGMSCGMGLLQSRRKNFSATPSINCELVFQAQDSSTDPFACLRLTEQYDGFEKLGEGSCGVVYKVRSRADNKEVAIKVMRMHDEENLSIAQKEFDLLRQVNHPNIIRALDFFTYAMGAVLVLDYFAGNKLMKAVRRMPGRHLQESTARRLSVQLLGAVGHLHERGVIHRDVKADNILVSFDMSDLRLVDFNAAKQIAESQALTMTGTVDYMPPEVLQGESPSQAGDIWAVGLCLYIMLDGNLPSERRALHRSLDGSPGLQAHPHSGSLVLLGGKRWSDISESCKQVLRSCLEFNSDLRPKASDLMAMSWLVVEPSSAVPGASGYC